MRWRSLLCLLPMLLIGGAAAGEQQLAGEITTRADYYQRSGNTLRLPPRYAHEGWHVYQDVGLRGSYRADGAVTTFRLAGVLSESDYRTDDRTSRLEWVHLRHEQSGVAVPYRLDLGDQPAYFTPLTLDRTLRAVRVEAQPRPGQSVVWLSGRERDDQLTAASFSPQRELPHQVHGGSWLLQPSADRRYSVNVVYQQPDEAWANDGSVVGSVAAAWDTQLLSQQLATDVELAHQDGRSIADESRGGQGVRLGLRGRDRRQQLRYDMAFRRHAAGFLPVAAAVERDSSALDAGAEYALQPGLRISGRYNSLLQQASERALRTDDYSLRLETDDTFGSFDRASHAWNLRRRDRGDTPGLVDSRAHEAQWTVRVALDGERRSSTRLAAHWLGVDDDTPLDQDFRQRRFELSHAHSLGREDLTFTVTPGVDYRRRVGFLGVSVLNPTLTLAAVAHAHRMGLALGYRDISPDAALGFEEYGLTLDYRYRVRQHTVGLEYDHLLLDPEDDTAGRGWRAGAFWRYDFDFPML